MNNIEDYDDDISVEFDNESTASVDRDEQFVVSNSTDESDDSLEAYDGCVNSPGTSAQASSHRQKRNTAKANRKETIKAVKDDGDESNFPLRIREHRALQELAKLKGEAFDDPADFHTLSNDCHISNFVWNRLYRYQKTGVRWLYELHFQYVGGILADEMGLGKTIQLCVFLRSLSESRATSKIFRYEGLGPSLIVCPATLLHQWVRELNIWFPLCKVAVLHSSGAFTGSKTNLIKKIGIHRGDGSILVTSYSTFILSYKQIMAVNWHYFILDEGHKIRNPEAKITLALKELRTPHRLILSGSPMQNNFRELWSLIDFIYPGRLGSLKEFMEKFSVPITQGGYANASAVQVRTAFKTACVLRDAISPYLLRRMKKDVQMVLQLPEKSEQILFCDITNEQRRLYLQYIESKTCEDIVTGKQMPFAGLMFLRKLCNHPDLVYGGPNRFGDFDVKGQPDMEFGFYQRSGKMIVLRALLRLWREQCHKVLLFSQSRQMLSIIESLIISEGYTYLRMDGTTAIGCRQSLVEKFNKDDNLFVFLLTTKVGGLGINLTGANRVLIFDPDWNPSTDAQLPCILGDFDVKGQPDMEFGFYQRSGKMIVLCALLRLWREQCHKVLLFSQSRQMLSIIESLIISEGYTYLRMDGTTAIGCRQSLVEKFNKDDNLFVFLLTTKVGGLGINLTGANRVLIFDPDWNPSTDAQARERAWRIGENLSKTNELHELFTLGSSKSDRKYGTETAVIFAANGTEVNKKTLKRVKKDVEKKANENDGEGIVGRTADGVQNTVNGCDNAVNGLSDEARERIRKVAKRLAANFGKTDGDKPENGRKKRKKVLFEGKYKVPLLRRQVQVEQKREEADQQTTQSGTALDSKEQDDYVLSKLLSKKVGVHSALQHDKIIRDGSAADIQLVEDEANAVAKRAAEVLKRSRRRHLEFLANASERGKCDGSGAELLSSIRQRKERQLDIDGEGGDGLSVDNDDEDANYPSLSAQSRPNSLPFGDKYEKLADEIRNFLAVNNGRANTNEILTRFQNRVHPSESFVFRSILKHLCKLLPNSQWILRDEFV
uniref:DNA repair and recombination protein RAD54-like n=1 Tax=Globodera pallida TaxID=36090 RepID=A0A183BTS6_GLOPA